MHELSIAQEILDITEAKIKDFKFKKIIGIELEVGRLSGIEIDSLRFGLQSLVQNTKFENSNIKIKRIQGRAKCRECLREFRVDEVYTVCPFCKATNPSIISGKELRVRNIEVE
jgi:hydrogenase nickel incorporation protein HypA/HybF